MPRRSVSLYENPVSMKLKPLIGIWILTLPILAQETDGRFTYYRSEAGLSHDIVYHMMQDRYGFLWIATEEGLNRFDGLQFEIFKRRSFDSTALPTSNTNYVVENSDTSLWVGTWGKGLVHWDSRSGRVLSVRNVRDGHLPDDRIQVMMMDREGVLWVGTFDGLCRMEGDRVTIFRTRGDTDSSLSGNRVWSLAEYRNEIWVGTGTGLNRVLRDGRVVRVPEFSGQTVRALRVSHDGQLWVGTQNDCYVGDGVAWIPRKLATSVNCFLEDPDRNMWVGTVFNGLLCYPSGSRTPVSYPYEPHGQLSVANNDVRTILQDRGGNIWIGTRGGGVCRLDRKIFKTLPMPPTFVSNRVTILFPQPRIRNRVWIGTDAGLYLWDGATTRAVTLPGVDKPLIRGIAQSSDERLWVATQGEGLHELELSGRWVRRFVHDPKDSASLNHNGVRTIHSDDRRSGLWIGTQSGLCFLHVQSGRIERISAAGDADVRVITLTKDGMVWVGRQNGLWSYDPEKTSLAEYRSDPTNPRSLPAGEVTAIVEGDSSLWIGTDMSGLSLLNRKTGEFQSYWTEHGLASDFVSSMVRDLDGHLWVGTHRGLCEVQPNEGGILFQTYDARDGLPSRLFTRGAGTVSQYGILYFGTVAGAIYFDPAQIHTTPTHFPVRITEAQVSGTHSVRAFSLLERPALMLEPGDHQVTFAYTALEFSNPKRIRFAYRLTGWDDEWTEAGDRRNVQFTNLPGGSYSFQVRAAGADGRWMVSEPVHVTVRTAWWTSIWFRMATGLVILLAAFVGHRYRVFFLQRRRVYLEGLVMRRTTELEEKNRELQELNEKKNEFLGIAAHDLRNPLSSIIGYVSLTITEIKEFRFSVDTAIHDMEAILRTANQMLRLIEDLLDLTAIESGKVVLDRQRINAIEIVKACEDLHHRRAHQKQIDMDIEYVDELPMYADRARLYSVIDNLLSNAIKYTNPSGRIRVTFERRATDAVIHVHDTGQGMTEEDLQTVFSSFGKLSSKPTGGETSTGLGLAISKKIVELHGGKIRVTSEKGKGSCFSVSIPSVSGIS